MSTPTIAAVCASPQHAFSKPPLPSITLLAHRGVANDCHASPAPSTSKRQIHLLPTELLADLAARGYPVQPGQLGENITTAGIDLVSLPRGTLLYFGDRGAGGVVEITGLRQPGPGIEKFRRGLLGLVYWQEEGGRVVRRAGVMGVVRQGGEVRAGDRVQVVRPEGSGEGLGVV